MSRWSVRGLLSVLSGGLVALSFGAGTAAADSLVYVKDGVVYLSQPDGSQARAISSAANGWAWPSETDGGIIAVAGGVSRITGGFNPSGGDEIYELDQQGRQVAGPVPTQGSYSTVGDPEYVTHFRVAPDNSNVAWTDVGSFTSPLASWRNPNGSGTFSTANGADGPLPYSSPEWWGSGHLLIAHDGTTIGSQNELALYGLADGSSPGWYADEAIGNAPSYQVAISRDGLKFAVATDDGPDYNGTIHNISITLETTTSPPVTSDLQDTHCTITLPASQFTTNHGSSEISMSFSSDGSTLAWGQDDGIYEANVAHPTDCATVAGSAHRVVAGGAMPFLGAAALSAGSAGAGSGSGAGGGGGSTPSGSGSGGGGGGNGTHGSGGAPNTVITGERLNKRRHSVRFRFAGAGAVSFRCRLDHRRWRSCRSPQTYKHLRKGGHRFTVEAVGRGGRIDRSPATAKFRV